MSRAPTLTLAHAGPVDHIAAARECIDRAKEHTRAAEAEMVTAIRSNAAEALAFSKLSTVSAGVKHECERLAEHMEASAQRIAAISSKVGK